MEKVKLNRGVANFPVADWREMNSRPIEHENQRFLLYGVIDKRKILYRRHRLFTRIHFRIHSMPNQK